MTSHVVVVGAGASGTLVAAQLLEVGIRVTLVGDEPAGRGAAYRTTDPRHLLNVPAGRLGACPGSPDGFLTWLRLDDPSVAASDFVPRHRYADYLADHLASVAAAHPRLTQLTGRVAAIAPVRLADGRVLASDGVVLALGNAAPCSVWVPDGLRASASFIGDPWAAGALDDVPADEDVLLVGSGLSAVDVALVLARPGRTVHAISRNGLVPTAHATTALDPVPTPDLNGVRGLDALRDLVLQHVGAAPDWRAGMDSLRPITQQMWSSLFADEREQFLRTDARTWDVHRHRMAPGTAAALETLVSSGAVRFSTGNVEDLIEGEVRLSDGQRLRVGAVINCIGAQPDLRKTDDPLAEQLFSSDLASPGPLGWGLDSDEDGRVNDGAVWTLGPTRRGSLWESTAIPEIRCQARDLALLIAEELSSERAA